MRRLKKKITSLVLLASFTASLSSMALAADVGTVTDDCVRLRRKASTSSDSSTSGQTMYVCSPSRARSRT